MFSVLFEVRPADGRKDDYLAIAKEMKPILESIDGFVDNERFESRRRPGWLLSLSTWRDEKSVIRWRTEARHHVSQERGRGGIFADYHLRVGEITADDSPPAGIAVREQRFDATETGIAKAATLVELGPEAASGWPADPDGMMARIGWPTGAAGPVEADAWESIYTPGKIVLLAWWAAAAPPDTPIMGARRRSVRVIRDYAMRDRREAPQYYRDAPPA